MNKTLLILTAFLLSTFMHLSAQTITTVAGGGVGDGGAASSASLSPFHITIHEGNMYITDINGRIRKIDRSGIISTIAGNSFQSFEVNGMGGQATAVSLGYPAGLAFDDSGNLLFVDNGTNSVFKVTPAGIITRIAGTDTFGYNGDNIPATSASLYQPLGIAVDATGNIFIADNKNDRIRKIGTNGIITTVAGGNTTDTIICRDGAATAARLQRPFEVTVDKQGNLYTMGECPPCKINSAGMLNHVAVNDTSIHLSGGYAMTFDKNENLVVVNYNYIFTSAKTYSIDSFGNATLLAGNDTAYLPFVEGMAATNIHLKCSGVTVDDSGNCFLASDNSITIMKVTPARTIFHYAGYGGTYCDGATADNAQLFSPAIAVKDHIGNIYIADYGAKRIRKVNTEGIISTIAYITALSLAVDTANNIYLGRNTKVIKLDKNGFATTVAGNDTIGFSGDGGPATMAKLGSQIAGIIADKNGNLLILDATNRRIRKIDNNGIISTIVGKGIYASVGDGGQATAAAIIPKGIALDKDGNLLILEPTKIRKVTTDGIITTIAGPGNISNTGDGGPATAAHLALNNKIATDTAGNIYFTTFNCSLRKIDVNGIITTIAGKKDTIGFSGDGAAATDALLNNPSGISVDDSGSIYLADQYNARIRKINTRYNYYTPVPKTDTDFSFHLYPNPTTGSVHLKYNTGTPGDVSLRVFNAMGKSFYSAGFNSPTGKIDETIDLPATLPTGVYFLQLKTAKGNIISQFVVLHN